MELVLVLVLGVDIDINLYVGCRVAHNAREEQGLETYRMGLNQFSDLTQLQFKQRHVCHIHIYAFLMWVR